MSMPDLPTNDEYLDIEGDQLVLTSLKADGTSTRTPVSAAEALAFVDRQIALHGVDHLAEVGIRPGQGEMVEQSIDASQVAELLRRLLVRVADAAGTEDAAITAIRAAIRSPLSIEALQSWTDLAEATMRTLWPNLDAILGWIPDENGRTDPTALAPAGGTSALPAPAGVTPASKASGGISATDSVRVGDPVLAFSGQLLVEEVDLEMVGIGLDVRVTRTYLHATGYSGPLGPHWDHSYNLWLREELEQTADGRWEFAVYRSTGRLSADRFVVGAYDDPVDPTEVADVSLRAADGVFDHLEKVAGRYRCRTPEGLRIEYGDHLRAERLIDRNDNQITLEWTGDPPQLVRLIDTCGRVVWFDHDDGGRLVGIRDDSIGRELRYVYDTDGRLQRVLRSVASGQPSELVHAYRYWGDEAPPHLDANIVALIDGHGREILQVLYGDEPGLLGYNRVVEQRDGGVTRYSYGFIAEPDQDEPDEPLGHAVLRVEMTLADGNVHLLDYNVMGRLLRLEASASDLGGIRRITSRWAYTSDGLVRTERRPDGSSVEYTYGCDVFEAAGGDVASALPQERRRFGELRRVTERPRPGLGGPPLRITEFDYDPSFGLVTERRGPYFADAAGVRIDDGPTFAARIDYDSGGNPRVVHHPDCERPDGSVQTGLDVSFVHDALGRTVRASILLEDGTTLASEQRYPPMGDPTAAQPSVLIADADGAALRRTLTHDAAGRLVRSEQPSGLVEDRSVDHPGRLLRVEESAPGVAPRVVETEWAVQDLPRRVRRTRAAADGAEEPSAEMIEEFAFDADGDVVSSRVRSADGTIDRSVHVEYGPERRVRRLVQDGVVVESVHDARGLVVRREVRAAGVPARTWLFGYDDAGRIVRQIDPTGDEERFRYDGFGRVSHRFLANGSVATYTWDAGDRLLSHRVQGVHPDVTDPVTLVEERRRYDACGRLSRDEVRVFDPGDDQGVEVWSGRDYGYDRADRVVQLIGPGSSSQRLWYDGLDRVVRTDGDGTLVETAFDDATRRVDQTVTISGARPDGPASLTFHSAHSLDARGAVVRSEDGLGNAVQREFDSDGNLTSVVDAAGVRHLATYGPDGEAATVQLGLGTPRELSWELVRDGRRLVTGLDGPRGQVLALEYDDLAQITGVRLPGGVEVAYTRDLAGRVIEARESSGIRVALAYGPGGCLARRRVDVSRRSAPTARDSLGSSQVDYSYDGVDRLILADDAVTPVARRFDSRGALLLERTGTRAVSWEYDAVGAARSFTYSDGWRIDFERDMSNRVRRVTTPAGGAVDEVARVWSLGPGLILDAEWRGMLRRRERLDAAGRHLSLTAYRRTDGAEIARTGRLSDQRGLPVVRLSAVAGAERLELLGVDARAGLGAARAGTPVAPLPDLSTLDASVTGTTQADVDDVIATMRSGAAGLPFDQLALTLEPDGARRRATSTPGSGGAPTVTMYTVSSAGLAVPMGEGRVDDADGLPRQAAGAQIQYDGWHGVSAVTTAAGTARVARDALGRPCRIATAAGDVEVVRDGVRVVEAHRVGGDTVRFVRLPSSGLVLEVQDGPMRAHPFADPDDTTIALLDEGGAVLAQSRFDVFGGRAGPVGQWPPLVEAFHGMPPLTDRLFVAPARVYDAASGCFLEQDQALTVDGPNLHAFARGNPAAFTDPLGLMAQASGASGAGGGRDGVWFGHGTRRADTWYLRAAAAYTGAVISLVGMVAEPLQQAYDILGAAASAVGTKTNWYSYEHRLVSGMGQMADHGKGTLGIGAAALIGAVTSPVRAWDAAMREDYASFGAEALNTFMLGKSLAGPARYGANVGVAALGRVGGATGRAWMIRIRQFQVDRLGTGARYSPARNGIDGSYYSGSKQQLINEGAFTAAPWRMFIRPSEVSGLAAEGGWFARARWSLNNGFRGSRLQRTAAHEAHHAYQHGEMASRAPGSYESWSAFGSSPINPLEWTQGPGSPFPHLFEGAWNVEMGVPYGLPAWSLVGATGAAESALRQR